MMKTEPKSSDQAFQVVFSPLFWTIMDRGSGLREVGSWRGLGSFERRKVREPFISYQMANLAPKRPRSHLLVKQEPSTVHRQKEILKIMKEEAQVTPPKRSQVSSTDDLITMKREEIEKRPFLFASSQSYKLDYLNSITFDEGKLYNLLTAHSQKYKNGRKVKCKCSKSKCESKYCECFSRGAICGIDCECTNCHNLVFVERDRRGGEDDRGCKCSKSHCLKNYCECFQRGELCGQKCNCSNCENCQNMRL